MRSPALISACSKAGCHAVLASLSGRYPPLEGRSPTCYSPVCHSTNPLRDPRVRLACVRHAASVDSEPGSNSHVKGVDCSCEQCNLFNARPIGSALLNPFVYRGDHQSTKSPSGSCRVIQEARTDDSVGRLLRSHALTLIVKRGLRPLDRVCVCACTHYLVFKEPTGRRSLRSPGPFRGAQPPAADSPAAAPRRRQRRPSPADR